MKKWTLLVAAGLLGTVLSSMTVWADAFPYKMTVESENYMEDYLYLTLADAELHSETCPELEKAVNTWASERAAIQETRISQMKEEAAKEAEELGDAFYGYNIYQQMRVARADERVFSLIEEGYEYFGDESASNYLKGMNFDVQTGNILELSDIVDDAEAFRSEAISFISEYIKENYGGELPNVSEETLFNYWNEGFQWYMNAAGIMVVLDENVTGTPMYGNVEVPLTFDAFSSYYKEEYYLSENAGLYQMEENTPVTIQNGEENLEIEVQSEILEYEKEYKLTAKDQTKDLGTFYYFGNMYLLKNDDGNNYVMYDSDSDTGDYVTHLYKIDEEGIENTDEVYGAIDSGNSTPDSIEMSLRSYVLGDYQTSMCFKVDENGEFAAGESLYVVEGSLEERFVLVTKVDIPAIIEGKNAEIPAGSSLKMVSTDNESKVIVYMMDTDQEAELELEKGRDGNYWENKVGGILESECFEALPYVE